MKILRKKSSAFPQRRWLLSRSEDREEHPRHSLPIPLLRRLLHLLYVLLIALVAFCSSYEGHFDVVCLGGSNSFFCGLILLLGIGRIIKKK